MDFERLVNSVAFIALVIMAVFAALGITTNITLAIILAGLYIGSNTLVGLHGLAIIMAEKKN